MIDTPETLDVAVACRTTGRPSEALVGTGAANVTVGGTGGLTVSVWLLLVAVDPKLSVATAVKV